MPLKICKGCIILCGRKSLWYVIILVIYVHWSLLWTIQIFGVNLGIFDFLLWVSLTVDHLNLQSFLAHFLCTGRLMCSLLVLSYGRFSLVRNPMPICIMEQSSVCASLFFPNFLRRIPHDDLLIYNSF